MPGPLPPRKRGRPPKSSLPTVSTETLEAPISKEPAFKEKRTLSENPDEFEKQIRPCKVMVRPILHGISKLCESAGTEALDAEEKDSGTIAFSALMYQSGGMLDARVLVALWLGGVVLPRAITAIERRNEKKKQQTP